MQGLCVEGHKDLDFADIHIGEDNRLFIDPARVHLAALAGDSWAKCAVELLDSFLMRFLMQLNNGIYRVFAA